MSKQEEKLYWDIEYLHCLVDGIRWLANNYQVVESIKVCVDQDKPGEIAVIFYDSKVDSRTVRIHTDDYPNFMNEAADYIHKLDNAADHFVKNTQPIIEGDV